MDLRRTLLVFVLLATLPVAACRSGKEGSPFNRQANRPVELQVENNHFLNVTVYAEASGASYRLGEVTGKSEGKFTLSPKQVSMVTGLRFRVDPIGSSVNYVSPMVYPMTGSVVVLTVGAELYLSHVMLR